MTSLVYIHIHIQMCLFRAPYICSDVLHRGHLGHTNIPEKLFFWMYASEGAEFSFDSIMYAQTDGVSMGTPFGPIVANIFVMMDFCLKSSVRPAIICGTLTIQFPFLILPVTPQTFLQNSFLSIHFFSLLWRFYYGGIFCVSCMY